MNPSLAQRMLFFRRVLRDRCPQCGEGELFRRWSRLRERCPVCGLVYRREHGAMTGSMYLSAVATELVAAVLAVGLFLWAPWSWKVSLAIGLALHFAFAAWFFPRSMSLWVAVEYATDVGNGEWWAKPR